MLLSLGIIAAAAVGAVLHASLPGRETRGVALTTLIAAAMGAIVWTVATTLGFASDNPVLWIAVLVIPGVFAGVAALVLRRRRLRRDEAERERLRIA